VGALQEDALIAFRPKLIGVTQLLISGHLPLAKAWATVLAGTGVQIRILSEEEVEQSFCGGLSKIVASVDDRRSAG
jgi:hypothetical protein